MRNPLPSIINWLRAGYPDDAPRTGYSPLLALNGPISLSDKQTQEVVDQLPLPCDRADIGVAITKATDRLPNESQVQKVAGVLRDRVHSRRHL
jgi:Protein of unknown function (DUF3349)